MKLSFVFVILLSLSFQINKAQNVGINTNTPMEKLDVNGNLNVRGTIKANGIDGSPGQFISRNSSGSIEWANLNVNNSSDDTVVAFLATTQGAIQTFSIPNSVTQIVTEAWGGGGAGGILTGPNSAGAGGGGGGGYIKAIFQVTPGTNISIVVGLGATSATAASGSAISVTSTTITALPGTNSQVTTGIPSDIFSPGRGGAFNINNTSFRSFLFAKGADAETVIYKAFPYLTASNTPAYANDFSWGKGGNGGNTINTGGTGGQSVSGDQVIPGFFFTYHSSLGTEGGLPGGGGGGDRQRVNNGGNGLVLVHY